MLIEKGPQDIGTLTRPPEIVGKLKEHQVTLPNGKLVLAQGEINNRILNSLVVAFKAHRPSVSTKELIAPDTSAGIPIRKAEKRLRNSVRRLRTTTLMGSDMDIVTIRRKKGGYSLANTTSNITENPFMERLILPDGKTTIYLHPRPKAMLQRIIDRGNKGMTTEELQQPHIDAGISKKTARFNVHDDLTEIRAALHNKPFKIENLTSHADRPRGKDGRYAFMEKSQEELAIIDQQGQNGTPVIAGGIETTVFVANAATRTPEPILGVPQELKTLVYSKTPRTESKPQAPELMLATYSCHEVLLKLSQGTLSKVPKDIPTFLTKTFDDIRRPSFQIIRNLSDIFIQPSKERLERFFRVSFLGFLDGWDTNPSKELTKTETAFAQIFETLKAQQYTKEQVVKEVLVDHFGLKIPDPTFAQVSQSLKDAGHS